MRNFLLGVGAALCAMLFLGSLSFNVYHSFGDKSPQQNVASSGAGQPAPVAPAKAGLVASQPRPQRTAAVNCLTRNYGLKDGGIITSGGRQTEGQFDFVLLKLSDTSYDVRVNPSVWQRVSAETAAGIRGCASLSD